MKINRVLFLAATLFVMSYTQARAEDCLYSYSGWSDGSINMDIGVLVYQNCYTDSSHSTQTYQKNYWISLRKNDGWSVSIGSDGKPIITNTNDSGISYSLETAPMYATDVYAYDASGNGNLTSYSRVNYDTNGNVTQSSQSSYEYNDKNQQTGFQSTYYDANGNIIGTSQSSVEYEFDENGDFIGERDSYYTYDEQGRIIEKVEEYGNVFGEHTLDYKLYEYNADGSYNVYDENNELVGKYNADGSPKVGKRIYTVEEATKAVSGKGRNKFIIRYR